MSCGQTGGAVWYSWTYLMLSASFVLTIAMLKNSCLFTVYCILNLLLFPLYSSVLLQDHRQWWRHQHSSHPPWWLYCTWAQKSSRSTCWHRCCFTFLPVWSATWPSSTLSPAWGWGRGVESGSEMAASVVSALLWNGCCDDHQWDILISLPALFCWPSSLSPSHSAAVQFSAFLFVQNHGAWAEQGMGWPIKAEGFQHHHGVSGSSGAEVPQ